MSFTDSTGRRSFWISGLVTVLTFLITIPALGGSISCYTCPGGIAIYDSWNRDGVSNNPTTLPVFSIATQTFIAEILTYHFNGGLGANPSGASIAIVDNNTNAMVYQSMVQSIPYGNPNTVWAVFPNIFLTPGVYRIEDSGRSTWSYSTTNLFAIPGDGPNWAPGVGFAAVFSTPEPTALWMFALGSGLIGWRVLRRIE